MGNLFCCEKMVNSKENLPMTNNYKAEVPLLSIELNKKSINNNGLETKTTSSNIEDHIFIDKTVIIGKGEGDIRDTYEIGRKIGGGSFGLVFLSVKKRTGEKVAIKAMKKFKKDTYIINNDLLKEVEILKTLDHQNILNIFEFYEGTYNFYIVTEYCSGGNLFDKIIKGNYLMSESRAAVIIFQVLSAINYCHQRNIIHRDLKPENIMIDNTSKNGYPYIKIIDFGTAKFIGKDYENKVIGSPYYIAPEVIDKKYSSKCDIWSIGCVLYFLLSKRRPFEGENFEDIFKNIKEQPLDLKSKPFNKSSEELKDLISKLLAKNPDNRISAEEALQHEWFIKNKTKDKLTELKTKDLNDLLDNIKKYFPLNLIQQTTLVYLVNTNPNVSTVKKASSLYIKLDIDNNGIIDKNEFINGLKILYKEKGENIDDKILNETFNIIDTNNDDKIEYEEFVRVAINKKEFLSGTLIKQAFEHFDVDKTGKITVDNITHVLRVQDNENLINDFQNLFDEFDNGNDGSVELNQFNNIIEKIFQVN